MEPVALWVFVILVSSTVNPVATSASDPGSGAVLTAVSTVRLSADAEVPPSDGASQAKVAV